MADTPLQRLKKKFSETVNAVDQNIGFTNGRYNPVAQVRAIYNAPQNVATEFRKQVNDMGAKVSATVNVDNVRRQLPNFSTPNYNSPVYKTLNVLSKAQPLATSVVNEPVQALAGSPFGLAKLPAARTRQQVMADTAQFAQGPLAYAGLRYAPKNVVMGGLKAPNVVKAATQGFTQAAPWGAASGALSGLQQGEKMTTRQQLAESLKGAVKGGLTAGVMGAGGAAASNLPVAAVRNAIRKIRPGASAEAVKKAADQFMVSKFGVRNVATGKFSKQPRPQWAGQVGMLEDMKLNSGQWAGKKEPKINQEIVDYLKDQIPQPGLSVKYVKKTPTYNTKRMGIPVKSKKQVEKIVDLEKDKIGDVVGDQLSFDEIQKQAQVSPELKKVYTREDAKQIGAQALALRQKVAYLAKMGANDDQFINALIQDKAFGQYTARLLGQRRFISNPDERHLYNTVIADILRKGTDPEDLAIAMKGIDLKDTEQLTQLYRKFVPATFGNAADKFRYSNMLSSPLTHINNASSNFQGTGIIEPIKKTVEGVIDAGVSATTGRQRTRFTGEGIRYAGGYYKNFGKGLKAFGETLTGKKTNENPDTRQMKLSTGGVARFGENIVELPQTFLEASDQFFKAMTQGGLEASNKYRISKIGGKSINATKQADDILFRGDLTEDGSGILSNFIGGMASGVESWRNNKYAAVRWPAKLTIPFLKIAANVAKAGVEYNPILGAANMIGNTDKTSQAAKMVMGGVVAMVGSHFALQDQLTFGLPTSAPRRKAWDQARMQPYSLKIGNEWYSYSKFHPALAFNLASVAAVSEAFKEGRITEDTAEKIMNGVGNTTRFLADQSFFRNVGDFMNIFNGAGGTISKLASNYPSQFIPARALLSWVNNIVDTYQRDPNTDDGFINGLAEQMMAQLPGLSSQVAPKLDLYGQPIERQHQLINAISPARVSTENAEGRMLYDQATETSRMTKEINDTKKLMEKGMSASDFPAESIVRLGEQSTAAPTTPTTDGLELPPGARIVGDKVLYPEDGSIKSTTLKALADKQRSDAKGLLDSQYSLRADRLKRSEDAGAWIELTSAYVDYLKEYQANLDDKTDAQEKITVQNKIEDLENDIQKYNGYGTSFTKGKKGKKLSLGSAPKLKAVQVQAPRSTPKVKIAPLKPLKINVAPVQRKSRPRVRIKQLRKPRALLRKTLNNKTA